MCVCVCVCVFCVVWCYVVLCCVVFCCVVLCCVFACPKTVVLFINLKSTSYLKLKTLDIKSVMTSVDA